MVDKVGKGKFRDSGIKEGFIILTMNNTPIRNAEEASRIVSALQSRGGEERALTIRGFYPNGRVKYIVIELN